MNIIIYILSIVLCVLLYIIYYKYKRIHEHMFTTNNIPINNIPIHIPPHKKNSLEYKPVQFHNKQKDTLSLTAIDKIHIRHNNNIIRTDDFKDSDLGYRGGIVQPNLKEHLDVKAMFL